MSTNICDINHGHRFTSLTWDIYVGKFNLSASHCCTNGDPPIPNDSLIVQPKVGRHLICHRTLSISEETEALGWKASVKAETDSPAVLRQLKKTEHTFVQLT